MGEPTLKLQRRANRVVKGKSYEKWMVNIPPPLVEELGWKEGTDLTAVVRGKELRVRARRSS